MSKPSPRPRPAPRNAKPFVPPSWSVGLLLAGLVLFTQRHVLGGFFALDDLILFQQAAGVREWPLTAWRWLSGWLWFRAVVPVWGHDPATYHAASLAVHLMNTLLLFRLARRLGAPTLAACVGAGLFGMSRLHFPALHAATSIGELLSLSFVLAALLVARPGARAWVAAACMALAVSCKETVLLVPLAFLAAPATDAAGRERQRALLPALATGALVGAALLASGLASARLGGQAYQVSLGANLLENVARLFGLSVDLVDPIPDLHATTSGLARFVLPALAVALTALAVRAGGLTRVGALGWWLAVLPVLPLPGRTYLHYLYVPLAALALAVSGAWALALARRAGSDPVRAVGGRAAWTLAFALLVVFALWNDVLLATRLDLRMQATDWPLDPVTRKSEIARRAILDVQAALAGGRARVLVMIPAAISADVDLGSGAVRGASGAPTRYELERVLDGGASLRAFVPAAESVVFVHDYQPGRDGWQMFLSRSDSHLVPLGAVPGAHARFAEAMLGSGFAHAALGYAEQALADRPHDAALDAVRLRAAAALAGAR